MSPITLTQKTRNYYLFTHLTTTTNGNHRGFTILLTHPYFYFKKAKKTLDCLLITAIYRAGKWLRKKTIFFKNLKSPKLAFSVKL